MLIKILFMWCPTHIVLCFCFVFRRLVYLILLVSLDCPFLIAPSMFSLTTHASLSSIRHGFAPDFVNYKNGALDSQPQMIKFTSCLPMVDGSLRVLQLLYSCGVQHILCCVFVLFFVVLCTLYCLFLWIVHF
jgi:hypothetical protein